MSSSQFISTSSAGPSFVSKAKTGPAFELQSTDLNQNLNADLLHGFTDAAFAKVSSPNLFTDNQTFADGATLPDAILEANNSNFHDSAPLDFQSSVFDSTTKTSDNQEFRWQSRPVSSTSGPAGGVLSLLFGGHNALPTPTGLSINNDGTINFADNQQLPASAVAAALLASPNQAAGGNSLAPVVNTVSYSWSQTPGTNSSSGGSGNSGGAATPANPLQAGTNTVTLTPCPFGVNGSDLFHYLYISGTGTAEAVLITGGTCKSGASSGTIQFTAQYAHPVGYSIGSASDGVQEALIDAGTGAHSSGQQSRSVVISPGTHIFNARVSIRSSGLSVQASGASITCNIADTCLMVGDPTNPNAFTTISLTGLRLRPGIVQGTWPAIEDNAQHTTLTNIGPASGAVPGASFGSLVQVDNDQAANIDDLDTNLAAWARCDTSFCSTAIVGPGPFSINAAVIWVKNSNLSLGCMANGIDNQDENTLHVSDSVVQAYAEFGIRSTGIYSDSLAVQLDNVYEEVGNCISPLGTGEAGLIVEGGYAQSSGTGPVGKLPEFASTGITQYNYYVVVHSSTDGVSSPYLAGYAMTDGSGSINVSWNKIGRHGTVTYDLLRTVGDGAEVPMYGTANMAIANGITTASCSDSVCTFADNAAIPAVPYTISSANYAPALRLWPGNIILTSVGDSASNATRYFADYVVAGGIVSGAGASQPTVFAQQCSPGQNWSPMWIQCEGGETAFNYGTQVGMIYQLGTAPGLKGRLIFEVPPTSNIPNTHVITFSDSNPTKTLATPMNRPASDSNDSYIGFDQPGNVPSNRTQLAFGSPVSISQYIGNVGDGANWLERLTTNLKQFTVPVSAVAYQTSSNCISAVGQCGSAPAGIIRIPVGNSTVAVSTTAVSNKSEIRLDENLSYGPLLGVTCDTAFRRYHVLSQTAGVGFTIQTDVTPSTSPACLSFSIIN
ncbi:MAG TPA: hypothetical protein VFA90_17670 [Terriglobales bacterium]|nr:hypothetical protein [Terriglobales bacterium]